MGRLVIYVQISGQRKHEYFEVSVSPYKNVENWLFLFYPDEKVISKREQNEYLSVS